MVLVLPLVRPVKEVKVFQQVKEEEVSLTLTTALLVPRQEEEVEEEVVVVEENVPLSQGLTP